MKCPKCNSEQTRLSWLRELTVVYFCTNCHTGFEYNRHRSRLLRVERAESDAPLNGDAKATGARSS